MSGDYRYQVTEHQNIQCLHVIVEHNEDDELHKASMAHCYIPVDDILTSFASNGIVGQALQGFAASILQVSQTVIDEFEQAEVRSPDGPDLDEAKALLQSMLTCFKAIVGACTALSVKIEGRSKAREEQGKC